MQSFFLFRKLGRLLFGEPLVGVGAPTPCRGALPERRLSFLNLTRRTRFSSVNRSAGWGLPPLAAGALPERRLSFLGLGSKGSLRFVVQLEVAVVQNQREENVYELVVDIVEDDPVGLALGFHA